MSYKYYKGFK